jgi:hypothetical protein
MVARSGVPRTRTYSCVLGDSINIFKMHVKCMRAFQFNY